MGRPTPRSPGQSTLPSSSLHPAMTQKSPRYESPISPQRSPSASWGPGGLAKRLAGLWGVAQLANSPPHSCLAWPGLQPCSWQDTTTFPPLAALASGTARPCRRQGSRVAGTDASPCWAPRLPRRAGWSSRLSPPGLDWDEARCRVHLPRRGPQDFHRPSSCLLPPTPGSKEETLSPAVCRRTTDSGPTGCLAMQVENVAQF